MHFIWAVNVLGIIGIGCEKCAVFATWNFVIGSRRLTSPCFFDVVIFDRKHMKTSQCTKRFILCTDSSVYVNFMVISRLIQMASQQYIMMCAFLMLFFCCIYLFGMSVCLRFFYFVFRVHHLHMLLNDSFFQCSTRIHNISDYNFQLVLSCKCILFIDFLFSSPSLFFEWICSSSMHSKQTILNWWLHFLPYFECRFFFSNENRMVKTKKNGFIPQSWSDFFLSNWKWKHFICKCLRNSLLFMETHRADIIVDKSGYNNSNKISR